MRYLRRLSVPQLALGLVLLLAVVCGAYGVGMALGVSRQRTAAAPPVLRWADENIYDISTLDPMQGLDYNSLLAARLIFGGLVRFGPNFEVLPDAAERWQVSPDGRTYTFYLRPRLRFGDGTPVTASDVAYSLNRTLSPQYAQVSDAYLLGDIAGAAAVEAGHAARASGIEVVSTRELRLRLSAATGSFLAKLATPAGYIVPAARVKANPQHWDEQAVGTGPFKVARWVHNNALLLVPNPYYYGGHLRLGGVEMPFIPEPLLAFKRYRAGALDLMGTVQFPTAALYDAQAQADFHRSARLETLYLTLNTRVAPFDDPRVRQAFAHALDKDALVSDVYASFAHPAAGMLPPGILGFNPRLRGLADDPALARRLLAQAGFPGGRGLPPITYAVDQGAQNLLLATTLAAQWQRVLGVTVHLEQRNHNAYLDVLTRRAYQIAVIDWTADYPDPQNFLSQLFHTGTPNNNGGWSDPAFDQLVDRADAMVARNPRQLARRLALYQRAEELVVAQAPMIPLVNPYTGILLRSTVHGLQINGGQVFARDWTRVSIGGEAGT